MLQTINKPRFYRALLWAGFSLGVGLTSVAQADIRLPGIIGDHMVIQQGQPVQLWGQADPGERITGRLADYEGQTVATDAGLWQLFLKPPPVDGSYELILQGKNRIVLRDVVVGEVWLASGQSNMGWRVQHSADAEWHIQKSDNQQLRLFKVAENFSTQPTDELPGRWQVASPESIKDFSAVAYFFGAALQSGLGQPVGIVAAAVGGTRIEAWIPTSHLLPIWSKPYVHAWQKTPPPHHMPTQLFNGMINPVIRYRLRGFIWYQGESNVTDGMEYFEKQRILIESWRSAWRDRGLFFNFVQLAPFRYGDPYSLPYLRDAQTAVLATTPRTGMAVTTDLGDLKDPHPRRKLEVGERLARLALHDTYGHSHEANAPTMLSVKRETDRLKVTFKHVGTGLTTSDGQGPNWFQVAGFDGQFYEATAVISGKDNVTVSHANMPNPVSLRFGWHQEATPNLVNSGGLPAIPFRAWPE